MRENKSERERERVRNSEIEGWNWELTEQDEGTSIEKLWSLFRRFGKVVDIYMTRKTLRNGKEFGFVRFENVFDPRKLEDELNRAWISLFKLRVFVAWDKEDNRKTMGRVGRNNQMLTQAQEKKDSTRDGRTYREKFLGGLDVLVECNTASEAEEIVNNKDHEIWEWMDEIRYWSVDYAVRSRLTWIKLYEVPVDAWTSKNFSKIASMWGMVIKTENCEFSEASTLVAGRILISTPYEFPLEKEEGDSWCNEVSEYDSVDSLPDVEGSEAGAQEPEQKLERQPSWFDDREEALPKTDAGARHEGCTSELKSQPERINTVPNGFTIELGFGNNEEISVADKSPIEKNGSVNEVAPIGSPQGENDRLEVLRTQAWECPTQVFGENELSGERNRNYTSRSSEAEKEVSRNLKKWDGGMSMRLFNKMVRDSNRRRGLSSEKGKKSEKKNTCPKSTMSNQGSKSRSSVELSADQLYGKIDEVQSLKALGAQIGFSWGQGIAREEDHKAGELGVQTQV
ncbi:hypothetical protein L1887_14468 [Cichorium endivia]|nr:hypothetical protein L1887_14468 [Cichorium endivia]